MKSFSGHAMKTNLIKQDQGFCDMQSNAVTFTLIINCPACSNEVPFADCHRDSKLMACPHCDQVIDVMSLWLNETL